jgi:hypothetical protein
VNVDDEQIDRLVTLADLDELVRAVDACTESASWDALVRLRDRCRFALETGRQLWPVASLASYRLALLAPGPWAAASVADDSAAFSFGPLTEVAASSHPWNELAPHLGHGPPAAFVAHERVLRGEDLRGATVDEHVLELPLALEPFEPVYPLAEYTASRAQFPPPAVPAAAPVRLRATPADPFDDPAALGALRELVAPWTAGSNGRCEVRAVVGDHLAAVAALGVPAARMAEIEPGDALAWLAWAGGSGGAHGRRRGAARGRFEAWWVVTALGGLDWPSEPWEIEDVSGDLRWFWWDAYEPVTGWRLQLAVWDPYEHVAFAVAASDDA